MTTQTVPFFSGNIKEEADRLIARYETKRAAILPILHLVQRHKRYIPAEVEEEVAELLEIQPVDVREVVTFYTLFFQSEPGQTHLYVCRTTSCWLRGAEELIKYVAGKLGVPEYQPTADGKFSWCAVECLGDCEHAPMMQVNDHYVGPLTKEKIDETLAHHA